MMNNPPGLDEWANLLPRVEKTIRAAGTTILDHFHGAFAVAEKSAGNPVTSADLAADRLLRARLTGLLPEAGWLSEETADDLSRLERDLVWIVDPLDGTREFVYGLPEFAVSVALISGGHPRLAAVYHPLDDWLAAAAEGSGLRINGRPAGVSQTENLSAAVIEGSRSEWERGEFAPFVDAVTCRPLGSIAYKLARVAAGLADATWSRGPKHEWDICAGVLLVQEGGGMAVDLDDHAFLFNRRVPKVNGIIADNGRLHQAIASLLAPHRDTARRS